MNNRLTTIEDAREQFQSSYNSIKNVYEKIKLKCWINHSESRHANGNAPFSYGNYRTHMRAYDYIDQIKLNIINVDDLGGKEYVLEKIFGISSM